VEIPKGKISNSWRPSASNTLRLQQQGKLGCRAESFGVKEGLWGQMAGQEAVIRKHTEHTASPLASPPKPNRGFSRVFQLHPKPTPRKVTEKE
jgi:hypothetical protein